MWPLKLIISEKQTLFWGFQHTFMGFPREIGLLSKWMFSHLSPWKPHKCVLKPSEQGLFSKMINLRCHMPRFTLKMNIFPSISLETFQHIYGVSNKIDGKTFIFRVNLGMWPLKLIISEKQTLLLRVSTHIYGVS